MTTRKPTIEDDALAGLLGLDETVTDATSTSPKGKKRKPRKAKTRQMSVLLYEHQIKWLKSCVDKMKRNGGTTTRKANVLRALIDVAIESDMNLKGVKTEEELKIKLLDAIKEN